MAEVVLAPRLGYRRGLDGLRAVAVLAVMAYHLDDRLAPGGFLGVELFFVLSGFLITTLLLEELERRGKVSLRRFYARRALRLFPALALLLAGCAALALAHPSSLPMRNDTLHAMPFVVLYVANWASGAFHVGLGALDHTWSLAVEEQFYLFWPVTMLALVGLLRRRDAAKVCFIAALGVAVARAIGFELFPHSRNLFYTVTRLDGLLTGCGLAFLRSTGGLDRLSARAVRLLGLVGGAGVLAAYAFVSNTSSFPYLGGFALVDAATALVIVGTVRAPNEGIGRALGTSSLVGTGRISYALYLWQTPVTLVLLAHLGGQPLALKLVVVWAAIFAIATASFFVVERPALRLKARFSPSAGDRSPAEGPSSPGASQRAGPEGRAPVAGRYEPLSHAAVDEEDDGAE